jgi:hypothetical protein
MSNKFCAVSISDILTVVDQVNFDIYIKLGEKTIKLEHQDNDAKDRLTAYKEKGLKTVFVNKEQYTAFLKAHSKNLKDKFFSPEKKVPPEDMVQALDRSYDLTKKAFQNLGINETTVEMAQEIHKESLRVMQATPNVFKFFTRFKKNAGPEFLKSMLTSYTFTSIVDTFDWSSDVLKEKTALATMLCDVLLEGDEIEAAKNRAGIPKESLPEKILNHPKDTVKLINKASNQNLVSRETVLIIEQHHEKPDGSGYPVGIRGPAINILSACYIIADHFIELCYEHKFREEDIDDILDRLVSLYGSGNFKKALKALHSLID